MMLKGRHLSLGIAFLMPQIALPCHAQDSLSAYFAPRVSGDMRMRFQNLQRDDFNQNGQALTLRFLGTLEFNLLQKTSFLAEIEGITALIGDYNDGTGNKPLLPVIPDPEGLELNRLQIITEIVPKTRLTIGRQRLALDDWRFIGAFPFRQNGQTIEAIRFETTALGPGILDFGYFNKVRRPLGEDNLNSVFTGDSFFSNYNLATLIGRVSLFHYATELETGPVGTLRQIESSQTTGVRVLGRRDWENVSIAWEGSYAQQSDYSNNLNDYSADYGLVEISIKPKAFTFKVRGEILGSDNGQGLQTPLASLHRFQGFADKFLRTPDEGVRDYSIFAQYDFGSIGPFSEVNTFARHHWFEADTDGRNYGRELNLSLRTKIHKRRFALEYADYKADTFSNDTKAVFLTTEISF